MPDLAIAAYERNPQSTQEDRLRLAMLQAQQGLNLSAHQNFEQSMSDNIRDPSLWRMWGDSLAALGQTTEALDKYKIAVRLTR